MSRLIRLCLLGIFALTLGADKMTKVNPANVFAAAYAEWTRDFNAAADGTIGVKEVNDRQATKEKWRQLEKVVDRYYRGEK